MNSNKKLSAFSIAILSALLTGCGGDAETLIIERDPIVEAPDDSEGGEGAAPEDDFLIESAGRLAVMSDMAISIVDLDDGMQLDTFSLTYDGSSMYSSANSRYVVVSSRNNDVVEFIDGGLWREDHVEHLHDYEQAPVMSDFVLTGSRPTHVGSFDGQMTVFYDGDSEAGVPASVHVLNDGDITSESDAIPTLDYSINMHGVAKAHDDILLSTIRRDDSESTSNTKILPDQIGVYHLHDGEYELEQTLEQACPDLHGAAQNETFFVFGCADGVIIAHAHDDDFESVKVDNIPELDGLRVGSVYGHKEAELFLGVASSRATGELVLVSINPSSNEMEVVDWQSEADASPLSYAFSYDGEALVILDDAGFVSKYELHMHDGEVEFEFEGQLQIAEDDVSSMPQDTNFSMTMAQNDHLLFVADPIAQHVLHINIDTLEIESDTELDVVPSGIVWVGIEEDEHDHDHD
jgi:hypothetical protein